MGWEGHITTGGFEEMEKEVLLGKMRLLRFCELRRVCPGTDCRSPPSHILGLNMAGLLLCWLAQVLSSVINCSEVPFRAADPTASCG